MRVALLGGGAIAGTVARAHATRQLRGIEIVGIVGRAAAPSRRLIEAASLVDAPIVQLGDLPRLRPDWILEAAGGDAARELLPVAFAQRANVILLSIGVLAAPDLLEAVHRFRASGGSVILPSGAVGGLDAIRALGALGGLRRVTLETTKAPASLRGAPHLAAHGIELPDDRPLTVFEGSARDAIVGFPANVNVAVAIALAGIGLDATAVVLHSKPGASGTVHRVKADGDAGSVDVEVRAKRSPSQPRTSLLAALSAVGTLQAIAAGEIATPGGRRG